MGSYNYGAAEASRRLIDSMWNKPKPKEPELIIEASAWCHSLAEARIVHGCLTIMLPGCEVIVYEDIYMLSYRVIAYSVKYAQK